MAEQIISDLLMKFVELDLQPIDGDAMTALPDKKGPMLKGFDQQHMFEVQNFSFKTGLGGQDLDKKDEAQKKDSEKITNKINKHAEMLNSLAKMMGTSASSAALRVPSTSDGFVKFRNGTMTDKTRYPVDMKPMEFERVIDRTSLLLLYHCINRVPFKSATLIKRKAAGGPASGEVFLRFDFNTVLIKSIDWDDGTPVKEKVEFICRAVTINYKPQLPNGTLGAAIPAFWKSSDTSSIKPEDLNNSR